LNARKIAFKTMVRAMFREHELHSKKNFQFIKLLIRAFVENNWSFLEFLLHFENAVFEIKHEIKDTYISALVPSSSRKSARDSLQKKTRRIINSICMQIMGLFKNYTVSGNDTHSQSMAIASLWPGMAIADKEISEMKLLLSNCIANVTAEEALFLDLTGEGFIKLREQTFLAIVESGGTTEKLFRENQTEATIKHLEDLIGLRLEKVFSFRSEPARERMLRFLKDFYESHFRRNHQPLPLGTTESYDGVAAVPILLAGESSTVQDNVPETNAALADNDNAINDLIVSTEVLDLDSKSRKRKAIVPYDKDFRLRKKKDGGGGGGLIPIGGGGGGINPRGGGNAKLGIGAFLLGGLTLYSFANFFALIIFTSPVNVSRDFNILKIDNGSKS
jgi:hypothetical protein